MCGVHAQPLRPEHGLQVIERMRKVLRRKTAVPPERLREGRIAWRMLEEWSTVIDALSRPPELVNGDGDPILLTSDRWKIAAGARKAIVAAVRSMEDATEEEPGEFAIVRASDMTLIGYVRVSGTTVVVETNSAARADLLRERLEASCAGLLGARVRSHSDPASVFEEELSASSPADAVAARDRSHGKRPRTGEAPSPGDRGPRA